MEELKHNKSIKTALKALYGIKGVDESDFIEAGSRLLNHVVRSRVKEIAAYELNRNFEFIFKSSYYKHNGLMDSIVKDLKISERSFFRYKKEYIN